MTGDTVVFLLVHTYTYTDSVHRNVHILGSSFHPNGRRFHLHAQIDRRVARGYGKLACRHVFFSSVMLYGL